MPIAVTSSIQLRYYECHITREWNNSISIYIGKLQVLLRNEIEAKSTYKMAKSIFPERFSSAGLQIFQ